MKPCICCSCLLHSQHLRNTDQTNDLGETRTGWPPHTSFMTLNMTKTLLIYSPSTGSWCPFHGLITDHLQRTSHHSDASEDPGEALQSVNITLVSSTRTQLKHKSGHQHRAVKQDSAADTLTPSLGAMWGCCCLPEEVEGLAGGDSSPAILLLVVIQSDRPRSWNKHGRPNTDLDGPVIYRDAEEGQRTPTAAPPGRDIT